SSTGGNGVIYQQAATSPLVGDGTYKMIYTYTLPGGTLGSSGGLRITCDFTTETGAASPNSEICLNSTCLSPLGFAFSDFGLEEMSMSWFNNGATNSQWEITKAISLAGSPPAPTYTNLPTAVDTTANVVIQCEAKQSSGTFKGQGFIVERIAQ